MRTALAGGGPHSRPDHADIVALPTTSGSVELMRASYHTQVFPRHSHEYFTLSMTRHGAGALWYRGGDRVTHPGDVVVVPPGEVHTGGPWRTATLSYFAVHIPPDSLAECADAQGVRGAGAPDFSSLIIRDSAIFAALGTLEVAMRKHLVREAEVGAAPREDLAAADDALCTAMGLLVRRHADTAPATDPPAPTRHSALVRAAREIIEDCYADGKQCSLRVLALHAGVSPFHLVRAFTEAMGLSPHRYLIQTRIRRASGLLVAGIPLSIVAVMTGFVDQSHLTRQFKRYVGMTPGSYQRGLAGTPSW